MGEIKFTNGIIMTALFAICIITFAVNFAIDNDSDYSLASDEISGTNASIQSDLIVFNSTVGDAADSFNQDNVQEGTDTATSGGQFKNPGKVGFSTATSTIQKSWNKLFGPEFAIIIGTLIATVALIYARYLYKTWFGKDPD